MSLYFTYYNKQCLIIKTIKRYVAPPVNGPRNERGPRLIGTLL